LLGYILNLAPSYFWYGTPKITSESEMNITSRPIDINDHKALCVQFRAASYEVTYGSTNVFYTDDNLDGEQYLSWLNSIIEQDPEQALHVYDGDEIIGQIEMTIRGSEGYLNLIYLIPSYRRRGVGRKLHEFIVNHFAKRGLTIARLTVGEDNQPAREFYEHCGWSYFQLETHVPGTKGMVLLLGNT
jgi:ribosomal protein S18 acetylase RimI-like enzyme